LVGRASREVGPVGRYGGRASREVGGRASREVGPVGRYDQ